ncbi:hypothetical protein [Planctomyces sp. SH-PL14]|uniref:hypothetical protein n=1 Tax=Planctomyces sp. SH-PL14 TaxID=1632864 RepID=UPI00078D3F88|nr:hypothetical protein [Planctomyces sp. SH-PL14]AMV16269.1 hypothetical protein VT03_00160 [Planctomyces sp. SH-PL14]
MSLLHQIRLRGPWEFFSSDAVDGAPARIDLPEEWERLSELAGPVRLRRRFHRPTGLDAKQQLKVRVPGSADGCGIEVNGRPVDRSPHEQESVVWTLPPLEASNVLVIMLSGSDDRDWSTWQEPVVLEIHDAPPAG